MIEQQHASRQNEAWLDLAPDLTPMLDILFILLVFFMLTAGVVFQSLNLTLPAAASKDLPVIHKTQHIMLEIRKTGYALDGVPIADFQHLRQLVPQTIKDKPAHEFIIAGDKTIAIEKWLKVLTYLQAQGIETANILMRPEQK